MNYDLTRIDYSICGITFPGTLKILPASAPKTLQKFAVGDKTGVLQCLNIKDEEPVVLFKTLPGKPITVVQLTNVSGSDKIFAASGNEVKGYTRKGKVFLTIETALSETITSMCVSGSDLVLGSGKVVTHYRDLQEIHSYICEDRVLDIATFAAPNSSRLRLLVLIANKGAIILENGQVANRLTITAGPCRLSVVPWFHNGDVCAFYGAADGSIGFITYDGLEISNKCLVEGQSLGSVMCLGWYFDTAGAHLTVGRHDGSIQLYLLNMDNLLEKPRLKFTYLCGEPVTSIGGGCIGVEEEEVLASTYSGRIFALRHSRWATGAGIVNNIPQDALSSRRSKLEAEVLRLEKQAASGREKYQRSTRSVEAGLSAPPLLDIQCELSGALRDGWQEVRVTSAVPLDMLFLYCLTKLDIQTDTTAVLSICRSQGNASDLLATVRCQAGTRRLWVRVRNSKTTPNIDAKSTKLLIYALPAGAPRVARLMTLNLPALPYYSQHEDPEHFAETDRHWCTLRVTGSFSVAEMTSWINGALPGELPRPTSTVTFARRDTFLGTILLVRYERGSATYKSNNITTIVTLKAIISNSSVEKSNRTNITCDVPEDCCVKAFEDIENKFKKEYQKKCDVNLCKALSSLDLNNETVNEETILCEDYKRVWQNSELMENETNFDELVDIVAAWYADWQRVSIRASENNNVKIQLIEALQNCELDTVKQLLLNKNTL